MLLSLIYGVYPNETLLFQAYLPKYMLEPILLFVFGNGFKIFSTSQHSSFVNLCNTDHNAVYRCSSVHRSSQAGPLCANVWHCQFGIHINMNAPFQTKQNILWGLILSEFRLNILHVSESKTLDSVQ